VDHQTRKQVADALLAAYDSKEPLEPLTATHEGITLEDAYAIQLLQIDQRLAAGRTVQGHKVGLTSAAMQRLLGVTEPDYGHLLDDFFHLEHMPIPIDLFVQPRIEPEVAFVLKKSLKGPGVTVHEALRAVDFVLPALEIVDSRIRDWKIKLVDTVADNASCGRVVFGGRITRLEGIDLRLLGMVLSRDGEVVETGAGAAVLGNPARCVAWLANTFATFGASLHAGDLVIPGAIHKMVPVAAGQTYRAEFAHLGAVTAHFVE
jgi:2-keto-4-pentenoate hydratase